MRIRLLKDWSNGGTDWQLGQLLEVDEAGADSLVKDGTAEVYVAQANDIIVASEAKGDSGFSKELMEKTIKEAFEENNKHIKAAHDKLPDNEKKLAQTGLFENIGEFARDIHRAGIGRDNVSEKLQKWDSYTKAATGLGETIDADGGFLVPTEFRNQLLKDTLDASIILPRTTVIPMASNTIKIPIVNESTRSGSVFGGIVVYRPAEAGQKTSSKPAFGQVTLSLHKLVGLAYVTDELVEDSAISLAPLLSTMFSEAIAYEQDDDFINGSGANQALGVLNAPGTVSQAKEAGQAATTIVSNNLFKMKSRLKPRSWSNAVWLANIDTYASLRSLSVEVGTGGSVVPLFTESGGTNRLDGIPIIFTDHCQTLGTVGDIILGDWRQYLVGQKAAGLQTATSIHLRFDYDETAFRFVMRYDGQPWEASALTPRNGANTLGSFVTVATRA